MDGGPSVAARQNLLDRLLDAVKQCQVYFGGRQEVATENDLRVSTLLTEWEAVLTHGMRRGKPRGLAGLVKTDTSVSMWPLAKLCLSNEEVQRFSGLKEVTSDIGRGRAWLRAAMNERTLETTLRSILADTIRLEVPYDSHAFLLDEERSSMLPVMAAGMDSIIFSIPVDASYLNSQQRHLEVPAVVPKLRSTAPSQTVPTILDRLPHDIAPTAPDDIVAVNAKEKRKKKKKRSPDNPSPQPNNPSSQPDTLHSEPQLSEEPEVSVQPEVGVATQQEVSNLEVDLEGASLSSSPSQTSVSSAQEDGGEKPLFVALDSGLVSQGSIDEVQAAVSATALVLSATSLQSDTTVVTPSNTLTINELRDALLAMVKRKEEMEETNRALETCLSETESEKLQLIEELEQARAELASCRDSHSSQQQALERENDLLREQLKKYVGIVQAQRRESSSKSDSPVFGDIMPLVPSSVDSAQLPPSLDTPTTVCPPNSTEHKMAEMAEMYGELMELNERLHRDIASKDGSILKLVHCIRQAGLKVPVEASLLPPAALEIDSTIDVWIPSVIKRGRGPDAYHVYQVFVKVKSEEWNVYRRYSEFREFHRQLQSAIPEIASFKFPPKKSLGSMSTQVIEERRKRLQHYLRQVFQLLTSESVRRQGRVTKRRKPTAVLKADITKDQLVHMLPFFKEDVGGDTPPHQPQSPSYSGL